MVMRELRNGNEGVEKVTYHLFDLIQLSSVNVWPDGGLQIQNRVSKVIPWGE